MSNLSTKVQALLHRPAPERFSLVPRAVVVLEEEVALVALDEEAEVVHRPGVRPRRFFEPTFSQRSSAT